MLFKVIQGHRFWYQSKAHMQLLLSCTVSKNRYIWLPLLRLMPPTEVFTWDNLHKILPESQQMVKVLNGVETLRKICHKPVAEPDWLSLTSVLHVAKVNIVRGRCQSFVTKNLASCTQLH